VDECKPLKTGNATATALLWDEPRVTSFATVEDVARAAEHLEHFHAYLPPSSGQGLTYSDSSSVICYVIR